MPASQVSIQQKPVPARGLAVRSSSRLRLPLFLIPSLSITVSLEKTGQDMPRGICLWGHHVSHLGSSSSNFANNFTIPDQRGSQSASPTPDVFELAKGGEEEGAQAEAQEQAKREGAREQMSAADYDPSLDRREDEQRRVRGAHEELSQDVEMIEDEEEEDEDDDVDDMFAVSVEDKKKVKKVKRVVVSLAYNIRLWPH